MGKKHKHPEHENLERWLVSYADFITLLFATFVVLYALAQVDLAKFKEASTSIRQAFHPAKSVMENPGGVLKGTPDANILPDSGNSILEKIIPKVPDNAQDEGVIKPLTETIMQINKQINALNIKQGMRGRESIDAVTIKMQERGIVISFSSSLFFEPGSAGLKPEAFGVLTQLAKDLKNTGSIIHVEGHTDSLPIATAIYPSNWELSTARASSVVRLLVGKGKLDPATLAAVGYAHTRPIADNATANGRRQNRRVDIVLLSTSTAKAADAGEAQKSEKLVFSSEHEGIGVPAPKSASETGSHTGATLPKVLKPTAPTQASITTPTAPLVNIKPAKPKLPAPHPSSPPKDSPAKPH